MNKKILFLMPTLFGGGAETVVENLIGDLQGHDIELAIIKDLHPSKEYLRHKIFISEGHFLNLKKSIIWLFKKIHQDWDVVFVSGYHNTLVVVLSWLSGRVSKLVVRETSIVSKKKMIMLNHLFYKGVVKFFYPKVRKIIFQSEFSKKDFESFLGVNLTNSIVLYNPSPIQIKSTIQKVNRHKTIVMVGKLDENKNHIFALEQLLFFKNLNWKLKVFGEGPMLQMLQNFVIQNELEDKVFFMGFINNKDMIWEEADLQLLTSYHESFPNVVVEGFMRGVPCIGLNSPGGLEELMNLTSGGFLASDKSQFIELLKQYFEGNLLFESEKIIEEANQTFGLDAFKQYSRLLLELNF